ncbi:MAG TPA: hypothetical protein VF692_00095 [Pyrinomonadaceae bacterium]|jgi:hypothetical protein
MKTYKVTFIVLSAIFFTACQQPANQPLSPTETMKALNDAAKKKDVETIKKLVSKGTIEQLEQSAKQSDTTVNELLKNDEGAGLQELPETRNEKINGDEATIEIKNTATNEWVSMPFVKENGVWKIAYDKFVEDVMKKMTEEMKKMPADLPPAAGSSSAPKTDSNPAANK